MIHFIDVQRAVHGGEAICKVLPIASSTYYAHHSDRGAQYVSIRYTERLQHVAFYCPQ
ncbi:hypothetical protein H4S14_004215 [Agrobacterium vitis]|nr:hypothetical protein [Agrobacterium vitis]MBE1440436.1 hypothetical protein [Agrobacterium vitis]